jgi:hypothetical protein
MEGPNELGTLAERGTRVFHDRVVYTQTFPAVMSSSGLRISAAEAALRLILKDFRIS